MSWHGFCAPKEELLEVENAARSRRGFPPLHGHVPTSDWSYLLTAAQKLRLDAHEAQAAGSDGVRVFDLGGRAPAGVHAQHRFTHSGQTQPTFGRGSCAAG